MSPLPGVIVKVIAGFLMILPFITALDTHCRRWSLIYITPETGHILIDIAEGLNLKR